MKYFLIILFVFSTPLFAVNEVMFVSVDGHKLKVEIADSESKRTTGLMFRKSLKENEGMLFVFKKEQYLSFWMKNTLIPLSIAYFNKDRRLVDIYQMKPNQTREVYNSTEKVMYALEVNPGWYKKNGISKYSVLKLERNIQAKN